MFVRDPNTFRHIDQKCKCTRDNQTFNVAWGPCVKNNQRELDYCKLNPKKSLPSRGSYYSTYYSKCFLYNDKQTVKHHSCIFASFLTTDCCSSCNASISTTSVIKSPCDIPLNPGLFIGVLIITYCNPNNPYNWVVFHPKNNPTNRVILTSDNFNITLVPHHLPCFIGRLKRAKSSKQNESSDFCWFVQYI